MTSSIKFISLLSFLIKITTAADTVEATLLVGDIGGNISMTCSNNGVTWVKGEYYNYADPITTTDDNNNTITINDDITLVINTLSVQHVDNYWCLDADGDTVIGYTLVVQDFQCTSSSLSPYEYNNRCYWLDGPDDGRSYYTNKADQDCIDNDGWNVFPTDEDTNTFICDTFSVIGPTGGWLWLGITDPEANNKYVYMNGESLTDSSWWNWAYGDGDDGDEYYNNNGEQDGEDTYDCVLMGYKDNTKYNTCNLGKCCWIAIKCITGSKRDVACQSKDISLTSVTTTVRENTETTIGIVSYDGSDLETALYIGTLTTQATLTTQVTYTTTTTTVVYSFNRDEAGIEYINSTNTTPGIATQYYFKLYVDYAPTSVTINSSSNTSVVVDGTNLVLSCLYEESNPIPDSYSWWVNDSKLINESNQNLTINVSFDGHLDVYQCDITNIVNTTRSVNTFTLHVVSIPDLVENITVFSIKYSKDSYNITLIWEAGFDGNFDQEFIITYYINDNLIKNISTITNTASFLLLENGLYTFYIQSCNDLGCTKSEVSMEYMLEVSEQTSWRETNTVVVIVIGVIVLCILPVIIITGLIYISRRRPNNKQSTHSGGNGSVAGSTVSFQSAIDQPRIEGYENTDPVSDDQEYARIDVPVQEGRRKQPLTEADLKYLGPNELDLPPSKPWDKSKTIKSDIMYTTIDKRATENYLEPEAVEYENMESINLNNEEQNVYENL